MVSTLEQMQVPNGTEPGVRRSYKTRANPCNGLLSLKVLQQQNMLNVHNMPSSVCEVFKWNYEQHLWPYFYIDCLQLCEHEWTFKLLQIFSFPHFSPTCFNIFVGVIPLLELWILEMHSFPTFLLLSLTFAYDPIFMNYRSSSIVVILRKFL